MSTVEALVQELDREAQTTKRVLERVPDGRLAWKPHEKSMSLGQLAMHVATVPGTIAELSRKSPFAIGQFTQASAESAAELVPALEQSVATARDILRGMDDAALGTMWRAVDGEKELFALPVGAFFRSVMLNHWYHHRGQLSVYLRLLDVPVPSIYGPSADENPFIRQPPLSA